MRALVFPFVFTAAAALALLFRVALLSRHKKSSSRPLRLVGRVASVERDLAPEGFVLVDGELWRARARGGATVVRARASVRVTGARGCVLEVEPLKVGPLG
jgi:membrane-bound serine protease (ClpP class)